MKGLPDADTPEDYHRRLDEEARLEEIEKEKQEQEKYIWKNNLREKVPELACILSSKQDGKFKYSRSQRNKAYKELKNIEKKTCHCNILGGETSEAMHNYSMEPIQRVKGYIANTVKIGLVGLVLFGSCSYIKSCNKEQKEKRAYELQQFIENYKRGDLK